VGGTVAGGPAFPNDQRLRVRQGRNSLGYRRLPLSAQCHARCIAPRALGVILLDTFHPQALFGLWIITGGWVTLRALLGIPRIWPGIGGRSLAAEVFPPNRGRRVSGAFHGRMRGGSTSKRIHDRQSFTGR
jgi:hypothetical protein